jgi:seryl-tRNA synthetase
MTTTERIVLDPPVTGTHERELASRVFFVSEAILDFSLVRSQQGTEAVEVKVKEGTDVAELARKLRFVVANDILRQRQLEPKVAWRGTTTGTTRDVFDDLVRQGIAFEAGEGQVTVGEPFLWLMDYFDSRFTALAIEGFGARERRYPTLIPTAVMRRCGYFQSFPQLMMFVSRLHSDAETYRDFRAEIAGGLGDLTDGLRAHCDNFDYCLPPTMCFHTYHELTGRPLPGTMAVTARGKSFRFESRYRRSLERLWDFTIREIVFLGSRDYVLSSRRRLMEQGCELVDSLGLGGRCEVATDPFFAGSDTVERVWSQQLLELKYELRLPLDAGRDVAVGSFNFHEQFFGTSFEITADGGAAHTACAGIGLERLAYAFLCRHGLDPLGWPAEVREAMPR